MPLTFFFNLNTKLPLTWLNNYAKTIVKRPKPPLTLGLIFFLLLRFFFFVVSLCILIVFFYIFSNTKLPLNWYYINKKNLCEKKCSLMSCLTFLLSMVFWSFHCVINKKKKYLFLVNIVMIINGLCEITLIPLITSMKFF
jgi:hypothetical protein